MAVQSMAGNQDLDIAFLNSLSERLSASSAHVVYGVNNFVMFNTGYVLSVVSNDRNRHHYIFIDDNRLCIYANATVMHVELSDPLLINKAQHFIDDEYEKA